MSAPPPPPPPGSGSNIHQQCQRQGGGFIYNITSSSSSQPQHLQPAYGYPGFATTSRSTTGPQYCYQNQHQHQQNHNRQGGSLYVYGAPPQPHPPSQAFQQQHHLNHVNDHARGYSDGALFARKHNVVLTAITSPTTEYEVRANEVVADELRRSFASSASASPTIADKSKMSPNGEVIEKKQSKYQCPNCPGISFSTKKSLDSHVAAHVTCRHEGCNYTASKGLVNAHYSSKHGKFSGRGLKTITIAVPGCRVQKFRICVGNSPSDIQAWIAERRKKFPTRARAKKKVDNEERRRAEGALGSNGVRSCSSGQKRGADLSTSNSGTVGSPQKVLKTSAHNDAKECGVESNLAACGALSTLLEGYGSSSDDEGSDNCERAPCMDESSSLALDTSNGTCQVPQEKTSSQGQQNPFFRTRPCRFFMRTGRCRNGDKCNYIHEGGAQHTCIMAEEHKPDQSWRDEAQSDSRKSYEQSHNRSGKRVSDVKRGADPGVKAPLLRKLLQNDIRRERSLTLQLLRYIIDCNYLQKQRGEMPHVVQKLPGSI